MFSKDDWLPISSRLEILAILDFMAASKTLLRMETTDGPMSTLSTILQVDPAADFFIIDDTFLMGADQLLVKRNHAFFEATVESTPVEFSVDKFHSCRYQGRPALRLSLPLRIERVQQRQLQRVNVPAQQPAWCTLPVSGQSDGKVRLALRNISAGGIAVMDSKRTLKAAYNLRYRNCQIDLPEIGWLVVTLRFVHGHDLVLGDGSVGRVAGLAYVNIPDSTLAGIRRYMQALRNKSRNQAFFEHHPIDPDQRS